MTLQKIIPLNLTLFDGEGQGAVGGEGVQSSPNSTDATVVANTDASTGADLDAEFKELTKGKYKDAYNKAVKSTLDKRFKNVEANNERLSQAEAVLSRVAEMTGNTDITDLAGLMSRLDDIDPNIEQEALDRGMPVDTLRELKKIERRNNELERAEQERVRQEAAAQQYAEWMQQAAECSNLYGDYFDLEAEMQNEEFKSLINAKVPVKTAFEVIHKNELVNGAMSFAAKTTKRNIAQDIRARGSRPSENGMHNNAPASTTKLDISNIPSDVWNEITNMVSRGEITSEQDAIKFAQKRMKK